MRVTKIIREYVTEKVNEKLPYPAEPKNTLKEEIEEILKKYQHLIREEVLKVFESNENEIFLPRYFSDKDLTNFSFVDAPRFNYSIEEDYRKKCNEVREKRESTIKEILVNLELGGTKNDLDEMIKNL